MTVSRKPRLPGYIINKVGSSERFINYLNMVSGSHVHFATTLNQNPTEFMHIYNTFGSENPMVSVEQEELGLTNQVKTGIATLLVIAAKHYDDASIGTIETIDKFIDYQLPIMKQAGLRFITEEKTVLMAAVWYSWVSSKRFDEVAEDLSYSFYNIFWLFLEPVETVHHTVFDPIAFKAFIEGFIMPNSKKAAAPVENANVEGKRDYFDEPSQTLVPAPTLPRKVHAAKEQWYHGMVETGEFSHPNNFRLFESLAIDKYLKNHAANPGWRERLLKEKVDLNNFPLAPMFKETIGVAGIYDGAYLLADLDLIAKCLTFKSMMAILVKAHQTLAEDKWIIIPEMMPGEASEFTDASIFYTAASIEKMKDLILHDEEVESLYQEHVKFGNQITILAETASYIMLNFHTPVESSKVSRLDMLNKVILTVAEALTDAATAKLGAFVKAANIPEDSIFSIGAESFYNNRSSINIKGKTMTSATQTPVATAAQPSALALEMQTLLGQLDNKVKEAVTTAVTETSKQLDERFNNIDVHMKNFEDRLRNIETGAAAKPAADLKEAADKVKATADNVLGGIKAAAKTEKKKKKNKDADLSYVELGLMGAGTVAVTAGVGYGLWRMADTFFGSDE